MNKMIVKKYKAPFYPRLEEFNSIGLRSTLPSRWKSRFAAGLLTTGAFAALLSGCGDNFRTAGVPLAPEPLTEQQVYSIIQNALQEHSISLKETTDTLDLVVPMNAFKKGSSEATLEQVPYKVTLDGLDADKKVGFEYLNREDYDEWLKQNEDSLASLNITNETLMAESGELKVGIFHEAYSEEDLKLQITTFLDWLKTQGVI
ncbi:MAG: hypothetical protein KBA53_04370 [Thermoclostridium sp.]|nr:hypothetical protein [Thermoclostridium sp.]